MLRANYIVTLILNLCIINMSIMMWETNAQIYEEINEELVDFLEDDDVELEATLDELFENSFAAGLIYSTTLMVVEDQLEFPLYHEVFSPPPEMTTLG